MFERADHESEDETVLGPSHTFFSHFISLKEEQGHVQIKRGRRDDRKKEKMKRYVLIKRSQRCAAPSTFICLTATS